jgi:hypothetical protein
MRRAEKVARRTRRNKDRTRKKSKALMVAGTCATAGTTLVAMATPALADYTSPGGFVYHPGTALQAGASVTVTAPGSSALGLTIDGNNGGLTFGTSVASYVGGLATGTVPLFADDNLANGGVTDCAGESITNGSATFAGCFLNTFGTSGWLESVPVTVAFPNVLQTLTRNSGLHNGDSVFLTTGAGGDPRFANTDGVAVEECSPMPTGVVFDITRCVGLGNMGGTNGSYMAPVAVQDHVGSTNCSGHSGSTSQCSLWTVEVHNDSTGRYWWPLADGIPISFK